VNRMVNSSIWSQKWFFNLQKDEKYLFLYLLTSSQMSINDLLILAEAFEMAPEELLREIISREEGKHD